MIKKTLLILIKAYQKTLSLDHGILGKIVPIRCCRFEPSCSEYAYQAIKKYGNIKGSALGVKRILRCNPWNKGGYNPLR